MQEWKANIDELGAPWSIIKYCGIVFAAIRFICYVVALLKRLWRCFRRGLRYHFWILAIFDPGTYLEYLYEYDREMEEKQRLREVTVHKTSDSAAFEILNTVTVPAYMRNNASLQPESIHPMALNYVYNLLIHFIQYLINYKQMDLLSVNIDLR